MIDKIESGELASPGSVLATLCSNLSYGFHAAAQPLAILRAGLDVELIDRLNLDELRVVATSSAAEIERICNIFRLLQLLVSAECVKPHLTATALLPLLADASEGVSLLFENGRVSLRTEFARSCQPVLINGSKILQAVSSILLVAYGAARPGDTVRLTSSSSLNTVRVAITNLDYGSDTLEAEAELSMALVKANIRSQKGNLTWSLRPFNVQFELQAVPFAH